MYATLMSGAEANLTTWLEARLETVVRKTLAEAENQGAAGSRSVKNGGPVRMGHKE